jgi:steroid delta-isomerase-like uncharacterized protein
MSRSAALSLIESYYAAFNAGDMTTFLDHLHPEVSHDINHSNSEKGVAAFAAFMEKMNTCYAEQLADIVVFANDEGTRASAEFVVHGKYIQTDNGLPEAKGQTYILPAGAFFDIRDGKVSRVTNYYNLQNWLDQVS